MPFHRAVSAIIAAALLQSALPACAQQTARDYSDRLKELELKFDDKTLATKSQEDKAKYYQTMREVRSELKKLIPILQARSDEISRYISTEEAQVNLAKSQMILDLDGGPFKASQSRLNAFDPNILSILKRRAEEIQRSTPARLDEFKATLDQLSKDRAATIEKLNAASSDEERTEKLETEIRRIDRKIETTKQKQEAAQEAVDAVSSTVEQINNLSAREKGLGDYKAELQASQKAYNDAGNLLDRVDERAQNLLSNDNEQNFFTMVSTISFAVMVGFVIVFFFIIAYRHETVRNAIFAGDSGIQFVTLFSLVIAIILFGVLRILEGKELAALLGGLSGYILGRGNASARQPQPAPETPPRSNVQAQTP